MQFRSMSCRNDALRQWQECDKVKKKYGEERNLAEVISPLNVIGALPLRLFTTRRAQIVLNELELLRGYFTQSVILLIATICGSYNQVRHFAKCVCSTNYLYASLESILINVTWHLAFKENKRRTWRSDFWRQAICHPCFQQKCNYKTDLSTVHFAMGAEVNISFTTIH